MKAEPMINLICVSSGTDWTIYVFPRAKHRPRCFYAEGEARLTISPGAIDMAGVIVVPERSHFERVNAADIEAIFGEVSLDEESVNRLVERVCASLGEAV
jgi:hypothetical protein